MVARIRTIKPEFWTSEKVVELTHSARLLFIGMWNFCDDSGICRDSSKRLKMQVFPGDFVDQNQVEEWLAELVEIGLVDPYEVGGDKYLRIRGWQAHQKIKYPSFRFPLPDGTLPESSGKAGGGLGKCYPPEKRGEERNNRSCAFEEFWALYPRKQAKAPAEKAWRKLKDPEREAAVASLTSWPFPTDKQYQPLPATWLNQRRWEDEKTGRQPEDLIL